MRLRNVILLVVLGAPSLSAADRPKIRIDLPQEFTTSAEVLNVKRSAWTHAKKPMRFGSFGVINYRRGWNSERKGTSSIVPPYLDDPLNAKAEATRLSNWFEFNLADGDQVRWLARCQKRGSGDAVTVRGVPVSATSEGSLVCALTDPLSPQEWKLSVESSASLRKLKSTSAGELSDGTTTYAITSVSKLASGHTLPGPVGFAFSAGDATFAAIDMISAKTVLLGPKDKAVLAAAASAILLGLEED